MREDIARWDRKFAGREVGDAPAPDPWLASLDCLPDAGRALDVASGSGQNAVWLAERGLAVTAIDGSIEGMRLAAALARRRGVAIRGVVADLDRWRPAGRFDLVLVLHYLNRPLFRDLPRCLAPGGLLVVQAFNRDFLERKPDFNPDYVLAAGELPALFDGLDTLEYAESPADAPGKSRIVCRAGG